MKPTDALTQGRDALLSTGATYEELSADEEAYSGTERASLRDIFLALNGLAQQAEHVRQMCDWRTRPRTDIDLAEAMKPTEET